MQPSPAVRDGQLAFYERFSNGDVEAFAAQITADEDSALVIGTAPDEWMPGRSRWISLFATLVEEMPGFKLAPGEIGAYEEGDVGWAADRPRILTPDGEELSVRVTAVLHREDGDWKVVNAHFSIGVPDERLPEVLSWLAT